MNQKVIHTLGIYGTYLCLIGVGIFLLAALMSSLGERPHDINKNPNNTTFVLDVSLSMNTRDGDIKESSRLWKAKEKIQDIVVSLSHDFGLTVFSGTPDRVLPHTSDRGLLLTFLQGVDRRNVSEGGTDIALAIREALLDFDTESTGNIILFTDGGDDRVGDTTEVEKLLKQKQVELFIVGVGSKQGGPIPYATDAIGRTLYKTYNGKRVTSSLNKSELNSLAKKLGATYLHIDDIKSTDIFQRDTADISDKGKIELTWILCLIAFIFWIGFLLCIFTYKYSRGKNS